MHTISLRPLRKCWEVHPDVEQQLRAWYQDVEKATWKTPTDVKAHYATASILTNNRVVFNIKGNQYRLIVVIKYKSGIVYIRFVDTHSEYDKIDATTI